MTTPKVPYNYATIEANREGVHQIPINLGSRGCVKFYLPAYIYFSAVTVTLAFLVGKIVDIIK